MISLDISRLINQYLPTFLPQHRTNTLPPHCMHTSNDLVPVTQGHGFHMFPAQPVIKGLQRGQTNGKMLNEKNVLILKILKIKVNIFVWGIYRGHFGVSFLKIG